MSESEHGERSIGSAGRGAGIRTAALAEVIAILARLRGPAGCPWDREQTFDSIMPHTLEETYEVFDAIERRAWGELKDELGDLLLQVLFYTQIAEEAGYFAIEDVAAGLSAKLIRRHPHIFGDAVAETAEDVERTWAAVKAQERGAGTGESGEPALLASVKRHRPALSEAGALGARASSVGFDWPDAAGLLDKVAEETAEIREALRMREGLRTEERLRPGDGLRTDGALRPEELAANAVTEELGDLLFTTVNLARHLRVDPEFALRAANAKFRARFSAMERAAGGAEALRAQTLEELERGWREAKRATGGLVP